MSDFRQGRMITDIHSLYRVLDPRAYLETVESRLETYGRRRGLCLLLPSLVSELDNPGVLAPILDEIDRTRYLRSVVVALGGAREEFEFHRAREYFGRLRDGARDLKVVWVDGPRIGSIFQAVREREIPTGVRGKGQSVWIALGYVLARGDCDVVALHDCDIVTYDRTLLARLLEPTANPDNDFQFCKGYYARISLEERAMKGRVTRLFVTPFVDAMERLMAERGHGELARFFTYQRSFKYPLAGEFSLTAHLARSLDFAHDWGLEVATLSQVFDRVNPGKIAQVDLAPNYEHKHRELSLEDPGRGLHRMVVDIARFYLQTMRSRGVPLDDALVGAIAHTYFDNARSFIESYSDDAAVNGLAYDRHEEELMVRHFRDFVVTAWKEIRGVEASTLIPSWNRVHFDLPEVYERLLEAVEADNAGNIENTGNSDNTDKA